MLLAYVLVCVCVGGLIGFCFDLFYPVLVEGAPWAPASTVLAEPPWRTVAVHAAFWGGMGLFVGLWQRRAEAREARAAHVLVERMKGRAFQGRHRIEPGEQT